MSHSPYSQGPVAMETSLVSPGMQRDGNLGVMALNQPLPSHQQVSLSVLIEFLVQRIYHDLTVLAELLPRKTDMERKLEIFNFASRSRLLLVRLLALVKWASSATKVEKCGQIMVYLERQAHLFTETADSLAQMARETLVRATLPNFHLPAAVEVLTLGQYTRVPRCVRDRIVPPEPITAEEKKLTLLKINQVIEQRLVSSDLPLQLRNLTIENGYVTFSVDHEFEATLTLTGDGPAVPWRLLRLKILVQDKETGEGKALVHSMQVSYLEQLVQMRLLESSRPLADLYNVLHSLCQSLQLEVIYSQTIKLIHERLGDYIRIEEYKPGRCLTVSYWRDQDKDSNVTPLGYKLSIQADPNDSPTPMSVIHMPLLPIQDAEQAEKAIRSEHLSMERLLVHTIYLRTRARLNKLSEDIHRSLDLGDAKPSLHGSPAVLSVPILQPCLRSEQLLITIDTHTGIFQAHVPQYDTNPFTAEIQATLNDDQSKLVALVTLLRYWIIKQRVRKTLQQLPATPYDRLPILFDLNKHPLKDLGNNKMYIRLHRQPNAILIVEFKEKEGSKCEMDYRYFLLWVKSASIEDDPKDESVITDIPKVYLKALTMIQFDPFLVTHATATKVDVQDLSERLTGKRKLGCKGEAPIKRTKFPAYFISDLAHVVAFADERIPFASLTSELNAKEIAHSGVEIEDRALGLVIKIINFPKVEGVDPSIVHRLQKYLLSVSVRMQHRFGRFWRSEFVFLGNPVAKIHNSKTGGRKTVCMTHDLGSPDTGPQEFTDLLLQEWAQIVHLFMLIEPLEDYLSCDSTGLSDIMGIKVYTFKELILEYGPEHKLYVKVLWDAPRARFNLIFGGISEHSGMCPHAQMREQLEDNLNLHKNLALLGKILHETFDPLRSIARLPTTPQMGVPLQRIHPPVQTFTVVPQSATHLKLVFYNYFSLDIFIRAGSLVLIRDGAISTFDQTKVIEDLQPIPWLKTFLMRYVDESALLRRHSQTEDDNPPSPMAIGGHISSDEISSTTGLRFPAPHTPPSNPLTPASPHTSTGGGGSSSAFLQSPPSIRQPSPAMPPQASPGPGSQHPIPSPSGFAAPSPANPVGSVGSPFSSVHSPMGVGSPGLNRPSPRPGMSPQPSSTSGHQGMTSHSDRLLSSSSRVLPQRLWAGANPTPLTHTAFDEMCKPCPLAPPLPNTSVPTNIVLAPLHRFLGCVFLRKQLQQAVKADENLTLLPSTEPGTILFRAEGLLCKVTSHATNSHQSLHLKIEPDPNFAHHWSTEHLLVLEKFFDTKVVAPPYRPNHFTTFSRILLCPIEALKDIVSIIRFEMFPEVVVKANLKWAPRICLTSTPAAPPIMPLGQPGLLKSQEKMLLFIQLTRANISSLLPPGSEPCSVVIPIVYDLKANQTSVAQKETNPVINAAQQRLAILSRSGQLNLQRCTILPSVQELLINLSVPNEGPAHQNNPVAGLGIINSPSSTTGDGMGGQFNPNQGINQGMVPMAVGGLNQSGMGMNQGTMNPGGMNQVGMNPGGMNPMNPGMQQQQMGPMRAMGPTGMMPQRMPNSMGMNTHQNFMGQQ